jgi:hypothetical protein
MLVLALPISRRLGGAVTIRHECSCSSLRCIEAAVSGIRLRGNDTDREVIDCGLMVYRISREESACYLDIRTRDSRE